MGLDGVELVMAVEEEFGISIADEEAERCRHPRDIIYLVCSKVRMIGEKICQSQRSFYLSRRALVRTFGVERSAIKLNTPVCELIPVDNHALYWNRLKFAMAANEWPKLVRLRWISNTIAAIGFLVFLAVAITLQWNMYFMLWPVSVIAGMLAAFASSWISLRLTQKWENRIPIHYRTVKDLVQLAHRSDEMEWTRKGIAEALKQVVIDQLGLKDEDYSEDADFVKDYGI
ncbi:MAG: hypothetical protein K9M45_07720 [Kiritimatiellales bacterium]|nr:hypothetical protein [Kiritimatiellales bacterium]